MIRVTLLTDFGTADGYAAAMRGVIAAAAPEALVETASHAIEQGDVLAAALALSRYARLYPEGTVHVAVVDPGVGTERRALAARIDARFFVAPDNGVLTRVLRDADEVELVDLAGLRREDAGEPSATFHGRDVFAPAAARLARGDALHSLGPPATAPVLLELPEPARGPSGVTGEVIQVDRFGNLISNIPAEWLGGTVAGAAAPEEVRVGGQGVGPVLRTYGDVAPGQLLALVGSLDLLEVSVRDGSAADRLGGRRGTPITVTWPDPARSAPGPRERPSG